MLKEEDRKIILIISSQTLTMPFRKQENSTRTHTKGKKKKDNYYFPGNVRISVLGIHADTNEDSDLIQEIKYIFRGAL